MIDSNEPVSWQDLQTSVARILRESGVVTEVEKTIETIRGEVSIDVWGHDPDATPAQTYLLECKRWRTPVRKTVVHGFRSVVGDSGANWGAIISTSGFQKGARVAAQHTNVRLLSWTEFQSLFVERWFSHYFVNEIQKATDSLLEYTEPINSRIFRKADLLPELRRQEFKALRVAHMPLGAFCQYYKAHATGKLSIVLGVETPVSLMNLPLRKTLGTYIQAEGMSVSDAILDARSYRSLLKSIVREAQVAVAQFDEVFGERA